MRNNFNLIAKTYDIGVRVVFGGVVRRSYCYFLDRILPSDRVLIVGGGTGQLLNHIAPTCEIDYVDLSTEMIQLARKRREKNVRFIEIDFFDFRRTDRYDWIIFPYFLDLFDKEEVAHILSTAGSLLKEKGRIIVTDFALPRSFFQKTLLTLVIWSLRPLVKLKITKLCSIQAVIKESGYQALAHKEWRDEFIFSGIYQQGETF